MELNELKEKLLEIYRVQNEESSGGDFDDHHMDADALLLQYIADKEVTRIFNSIEKWYA